MKLVVAAILLGPCLAAAAAGDSLAARCERLAGAAQVSVAFEDRQVSRDDSRSLDELKRLSQSRASRYHHVLGLTHAEPTVAIDFTARFLTDGNGRVCAVPSLNIRLSFSAIQVYLARELADPCRRRVVLEHEQEHVETWRAHFRAGARMLMPLLQAQLAHPYYFNSRAEAEAGLQPLVEAEFSPLLQHLRDGIGSAQQEIDSAGSYALVEGRLRTCP